MKNIIYYIIIFFAVFFFFAPVASALQENTNFPKSPQRAPADIRQNTSSHVDSIAESINDKNNLPETSVTSENGSLVNIQNFFSGLNISWVIFFAAVIIVIAVFVFLKFKKML